VARVAKIGPPVKGGKKKRKVVPTPYRKPAGSKKPGIGATASATAGAGANSQQRYRKPAGR